MAEQSHKNKLAEMTERIIKQVKEGQAPWQKPWKGGVPMLPMNPTTGKTYMGINTFFLLSSGFEDPRWMTYRQAQKVGAQVNKGEKATPILYWQTHEEKIKRDEKGKPVIGEDGKPVKIYMERERPRALWSAVFNAEQIEGLPPLKEKEYKEPTWESAERAERALKLSGVPIKEIEGGGRAFYSPMRDQITLPGRGQFESAAGFYQTALHELAHATGHESRLKRDLSGSFGSENYAREELVAELGSMYLGAATGVGFTPNDEANAASYIQHWVSFVEKNPAEIMQAANKASHAAQFVMNKVIDYEKANGIEYDMNDTIEILQPSDISIDEQEELAAGQKPEAAQERENRTYIDVPYREKNEAKALGAKWDKKLTSWYVPEGVDIEPFKKWLSEDIRKEVVTELEVSKRTDQQIFAGERLNSQIHEPERQGEQERYEKVAEMEVINERALAPEKISESEMAAEEKRTYLAVPYREKDKAKAMGAKWDKEVKSWYFERDSVTPENREKLLADYSKEKQASKTAQPTRLLPEQEFAKELEKLGCDLEAGRHPIMNGQKQRIRVQGDKGKEQSGFYVAYKDGRPNAYFCNNRTGETIKWKGQTEALSAEQRQQLIQKAQERRQEIEQTREANELKTQAQVQSNLKKWTPAAEATFPPSNYLEKKGIAPTVGTYQTKYGDLCVPAMDMQGNVWTAQYIKADGSSKSFATDGRLNGMFHPVGQVDLKEVDKSKAIIIAEGYATGCTIKEAVGESNTVVVAFKAHSLKDVATQFREKYPDKPILIAGDDDKHLVQNPQIKKNIGAEKAKEAAEAVNGVAILPKFSPSEQRKLDSKDFTDFNDLAVKSSLGMTAVKKQVESGLAKAQKLIKQQDKEKSQSAEMAKTKPRKSPTVKTKTPENAKPQGVEI